MSRLFYNNSYALIKRCAFLVVNVVMEENSKKYGSMNSDSNSYHTTYKSQALANSNLNLSKFPSPLGIPSLPNYYNKSSVKELPMESSFTEFPLKNKNQEIRILGNPTDQKYFVVCNFCFWCASCTNARYSFAANNTCPSCNEGMIEWLPIAEDENYDYSLSSTGGIELEFSSRRAEGRRA